MKKSSAVLSRSSMALFTGVSRDLFNAVFMLYLFLFVLETIIPGFVENFFNMDILLWVVIVLGGAMVVLTNLKPENTAGIPRSSLEEHPLTYEAVISVVFIVLLCLVSSDLGRSIYLLFLGMGVSLLIFLNILFDDSITTGRETGLE